jgi:transaldolase
MNIDILERLSVKIFADGADKSGMLEMYAKPYIKGFTTNPTLMRKAGVSDFEGFSREMLRLIPDRPISLEVFADDLDEMEKQARYIATWGNNVYVKIPVTDTRGCATTLLVRKLSGDGIKVNVTAIMTTDQVRMVREALLEPTPAYVSVFAGRIADTGRDPIPLMREALNILEETPHAELIWASPRELLNIFHADSIGCHIITVTNDILKKLVLIGKDLTEYSLETVQMFFDDASTVGYRINTTHSATEPVS